MKQGARYLRFSNDKQTQNSIERQDIVTEQWMRVNEVNIVDTFTDKGYSAKNFDRPDMKMLMNFIKKNNRTIDYLVVSELTRFSRDLGDAVNLVKDIQKTYNVKIVSAGRGAIYDCTESNSFFMMALEFLLGNSENIKRESDVNGGIYAAKAKHGRYIHSKPPYGYIKEGIAENSRLVIDEDNAMVVRFIYEKYLQGMPFNIIAAEARKMGYKYKGKMQIQRILSNVVYSGRLEVKPWREHPGGIFPGIHEAIIDVITWEEVKDKMTGKPARPKIAMTDEMPLRGVLKCHCNQLLTGAPSRGKLGTYYYYYKCKHSGHNNISATKAHAQLNEIWNHMSLTDRLAGAIKLTAEKKFTERSKENRKLLTTKKNELEEISNSLQSIEEKWILNKIEYETYTKWFSNLTQRRSITTAQITNLKRDDNELYTLLQHNIDRFTDLQYLYTNLETFEKQTFIKLVFDSGLYYQGGLYRTPYIMPIFSHNQLILKEKSLLLIDEKRGFLSKAPGRVHNVSGIEPLTQLLSFLKSVSAA